MVPTRQTLYYRETLTPIRASSWRTFLPLYLIRYPEKGHTMTSRSFLRVFTPSCHWMCVSLGAVVPFYGNANAHESDGRPRPCAIMSRSQRIVAQDAWNSMAVYEISDGALVHRFGSGGWVRRFAITQDDRYALLCSASGELHLWDVEAGERLWHQLAGLNDRARFVCSPR